VREAELLAQRVADDDRDASIPPRSRRRIARCDGVVASGMLSHVGNLKLSADRSSVCSLSASGADPRALRSVHSFGDQLR
jgi:hypothetical protein